MEGRVCRVGLGWVRGESTESTSQPNLWSGQRVTQAWKNLCTKNAHHAAKVKAFLYRLRIALYSLFPTYLVHESYAGRLEGVLLRKMHPHLPHSALIRRPLRPKKLDHKLIQPTQDSHFVLWFDQFDHICVHAPFSCTGRRHSDFSRPGPLLGNPHQDLHPLKPFLMTLQSALSGRGFSSRLTWIKNFHRHFCQTRSWSFSALKAFLLLDLPLRTRLWSVVPNYSSSAASDPQVWLTNWHLKGLYREAAVPEWETSTVERGGIPVSWSLFSWHSFRGPCHIWQSYHQQIVNSICDFIIRGHPFIT